MEILHSNWPNSVDRWRYHGVLDLSDPPEDEAITRLRGAHINPMVKTADGTVYGSVGGGCATSGVSVDVVRHCNRAKLLLKRMEQEVRKTLEGILPTELEAQGITNNQFQVHLELYTDGAYAVDRQSPLALSLGDRKLLAILYGDPGLPLRSHEGVQTHQPPNSRCP